MRGTPWMAMSPLQGPKAADATKIARATVNLFILAVDPENRYSSCGGGGDHLADADLARGDQLAWIDIIEEPEADGELKGVYADLMKERGKIANILRVHSLDPGALKAHMSLYVALMFGESGLTRQERELIAVVVSSANACHYCVAHHGEALKCYWGDEGQIDELARDHASADLPPRTGSMLAYAAKLTRTPSEVREEDVRGLRGQGFSDREILHVNLITSYFNFVNRVALGLGVEFSPEEVSGYDY
jgi:uncharacterized peroxidase-related enzyme